MISHDRVRCALNHEEPDRVPMDLGGSVVTSIALSAYGVLREHLGLPRRDIRVLETVQQIAGGIFQEGWLGRETVDQLTDVAGRVK